MHYNHVQRRVEKAISVLRSGRSIIVLDDKDRENEGDLILPSKFVNEDNMNLMLQNTSGIICLAITPCHMEKLKLDPMVPEKRNSSNFRTPFTVSIDAKEGIKTGISVKDRALTIEVAGRANACSEDISKPGHIFPLVSNEYGVLGRQGHTEASVDITRIAGLYPTAALCELMNKDGSVMKGRQIEDFAEAHDLPILSIEDIRVYRLANEVLVRKEVTTPISFKYIGKMYLSVFRYLVTGDEVVVLSRDENTSTNPLVRIHSECITGDLFGSLKCDCQSQLQHALSEISKKGGILIYLNQEGRNIGLVNKLKAYELQRVEGFDTIDANKALQLPVDARSYDIAFQILNFWGIQQCQLLSNNPEKVKALQSCGISVTRKQSLSDINDENKSYLTTKKYRLKHNIKGVS